MKDDISAVDNIRQPAASSVRLMRLLWNGNEKKKTNQALQLFKTSTQTIIPVTSRGLRDDEKRAQHKISVAVCTLSKDKPDRGSKSE